MQLWLRKAVSGLTLNKLILPRLPGELLTPRVAPVSSHVRSERG
jgi:hypothetical protein